MASQTEKAKARLNTLSSSLDDFEVLLEPLFAQTLPESTLALEPIKQAKLQTVLPYLVYDLIFIYLKLRGIDPKTHPVVSELDRVKEYFNKISEAENPPKKNVEIDKDAAQRFIKHAIKQTSYEKETEEQPKSSSSSSIPRVQAKITSKMIARQLYEEKLKEQDAAAGSEEESLEIFGEVGEEDVKMDVETGQISPEMKRKSKGKAKDTPSTVNDSSENRNSKKRRRPAVDPFAGYGNDDSSPLLGDPRVPDALDASYGKKRALEDSPETNVTPGQQGSGSNTSDEFKQLPDKSISESKLTKKSKTKKKKKKKKSSTTSLTG